MTKTQPLTKKQTASLKSARRNFRKAKKEFERAGAKALGQPVRVVFALRKKTDPIVKPITEDQFEKQDKLFWSLQRRKPRNFKAAITIMKILTLELKGLTKTIKKDYRL